MRKDRNGTAITKGSKKHKITFRDEIPIQILEVKKEGAIQPKKP